MFCICFPTWACFKHIGNFGQVIILYHTAEFVDDVKESGNEMGKRNRAEVGGIYASENAFRNSTL
jgi:hypothetical protein